MLAKLWAWGIVLVTLGGLALAVVLAPKVSRTSTIASSRSGALGWLLFVGTSVHVAATGCLFVLPEVRLIARRNRLRVSVVPSGVISFAALVSVLVAPSRMALPLLAIFAWQFWHYQKQNLGMAALAAASHRVAALIPGERRAIRSTGAAGILGLVAHPRLLGLNVRLQLEPMWVMAELLLVASACYGLALLASRAGSDRPVAFSAVFALSLLFWTPMFLFESPYAAVGGMIIAHGIQYLALVGSVVVGPTVGSCRLERVVLALGAALLAGALLSWSSHLHTSPSSLRVLFGAYLGVLMTHFIIDGRLWRLRDPLASAFLAARLPYLLPARVVPVAGGSADGIG